MSKGMTHIYTGEGKGKTTAATGLAVRALGQRQRVGFFQFLKNGISGEVVSLAKLGAITVCPETKKFIWNMDEDERAACAQKQQETFRRAIAMADQFDLIVLDEVISAVDAGLLGAEEVLDFIKNRPENLELVLTGRGDISPFRDCCDYITEMKLVAHPFEKGQTARKGIEF